MKPLVYCIKCEKMVLLESDKFPFHIETSYIQGFPESDFCMFEEGIAYCPPPEERPDWEYDEEPIEIVEI